MLRVGHLERELADGHAIGAGGDVAGHDVHAVVREHARHIAQQMRAIQRLHLDLDHEQALRARPLHGDDAFGLPALQVDHVLAVGTVHRYALVAGDEADDVIAGDGRAAARQLDPDIAHALDGDAQRVGGLGAFRRAAQRQQLLLGLLVHLVGTGVLDQMGDDVLRGDLAVADGREQTVRVRVVELVGHADQRLERHQRGDRQVALAHGAGQVVAAFLDGLAAAFLAEPLPDLVAGLRALDEAQPVAGRTGGIGLGGEHLHGVAVLQFGVQRHQTAVDARAHRTMAHLGVHGVGEVDRRGLRGQGHDLALRREHVDLGRAEILLQRTQELVRVGGLARPIGKLLDPLEVVGLAELLVLAVLTLTVVGVRRAQRTPGLPVGLVLPMRGDAELGAPVHVPCADLDLHRLAARAHHRSVQALVHVELGHGDVVLEPARHRAPPRVHGAERRIAVADRIDDDAHAHQVVDVLEIMPAHDHLLVDREIVLRTARDVGLDVLFFEILVDLAQDLLEVHVALAGPAGHQHHDLVVDLRVEHLEAQFLELRLDGVHAQPVGQRGVHVQRLAGLLLRAGGFHVPPGAGVVHTVGELDDQHAHVAAHRHHHLADGLGLRRIAVFHLGELGHAVHQTGDGVAEFGAALLQRVVGVLHRVVQQAGRHHQGAHAQVRQNLGHRQRMDDVRLA